MLFLVIIYFIQTLISMSYLEPDDFYSAFKSRQYAQEIYEYSVTIERMKVLHALALGSIAIATLYFTLKFKMLNPKHYCQLMTMSILATLMYFAPVSYICWVGYKDTQSTSLEAGHAVTRSWDRFFDFMEMILKRTDMGAFGMIVSILVHAQIYGILFIMQFCAQYCNKI